MPRDESEALLQRLFEIAEDPAIIYEHVWRVGDLIMWDNRPFGGSTIGMLRLAARSFTQR